MTKLSNATLAGVRGVRVPDYDRTRVTAGIAHVGVGNFHRVHEAVYVDDCLHRPGHEGWGIVGIGLMDDAQSRAKAAAFPAQDGLYTVTSFAPDGARATRVIGAMVEYLHAPSDPEAVLVRLTDPAIRVVSLTVTEGGYGIDETTGEFRTDAPDVARDLAGGPPRTVFGCLAEALARRRRAGTPPFTVVSCDNLRGNGDTARKAIASFARARDPELGAFVDREVAFPNGMVDRIAPRVSDADRDRLNARSGIDDAFPAVCESYTQWVIEDHFPAGRPELEAVGVELRDDVPAFEAVKGRLLNASHMLLSYPSLLCGYRLVHDAVADWRLRELLDRFMDRDAVPLIEAPPGVSLEAYKAQVLARFSNVAIRDQLLRIAHDGAAKIPVFHTRTLAMLARAGGDMRREAFFLACFRRYLAGVDDRGAAFEVFEPHLDGGDLALARGDDPLGLLRTQPFRALTLDAHPPFVEAYLGAVEGLRTGGAARTLEALHETS
ncbi:mannitol dehydrogenase [Gemmatimonadetes bacterium T265]|nr:mannitol dehydrogenase [Gemmatimonadetes bacterium T265]